MIICIGFTRVVAANFLLPVFHQFAAVVLRKIFRLVWCVEVVVVLVCRLGVVSFLINGLGI